MKLEEVLQNRSGNKCELCGSTDDVKVYEVLPQDGRNADNCIMACEKCRAQIDKKAELEPGHWKPLSETYVE
jgi:protein PhnA